MPIYMLSLMKFLVNNQEEFQTNVCMNSISTRDYDGLLISLWLCNNDNERFDTNTSFNILPPELITFLTPLLQLL